MKIVLIIILTSLVVILAASILNYATYNGKKSESQNNLNKNEQRNLPE